MSREQSEHTAQISATTQTSQLRRRQMPSHRRRNLVLLTITFLIIAAVVALMYFFVWQYRESTEDAYVNAHTVQITPRVGGTVQQVLVDDTQMVQAGDVLVTLDNSDILLAFDRARSALINAIRQTKQQDAIVVQTQSQVALYRAKLASLQSDLHRRESLAGTDAVSGEELSHIRAAVTEAKAGLDAAVAQSQSARAAIGHNIPVREQPAVVAAISQMKDAWLNLQRTQIRAPISGQIAKRNVQVGQTIAAGMPLMAIIPVDHVWVDANFKEGQLANLRIGQPAKVTADIYGSQVEYQGRVAGVSAGTGAAFSLLPAQNATGNWIKVVQRVPVRIELNPQQLLEHPLRVGLSMSVEVDTSPNSKQITANQSTTHSQIETSQFVDWHDIDKEIDQILAEYGN